MTDSRATIWPPVRTPKADAEAIFATFPTWIRPYVPAQPPHQIRVVWSVETGFACWFSDSGKFSSFPTFREAYTVAGKFPKSQYEWVMDRSLLLSPDATGSNPILQEGWGSEERFDYLSTMNVRNYVSGGLAMVFSDPWEKKVESIMEGFFDSHKAVREWLTDQANPVAAFRMIQTHPMLWTFSPSPRGDAGGWWSMENGIDLVSVDMFMGQPDGKDQAPKPLVRLESGPHDDKTDYAHHQRYLDLELTVQEDTYESALCSLAKNIHQRYTCCGEDLGDQEPADLTCYYHVTEHPNRYNED